MNNFEGMPVTVVSHQETGPEQETLPEFLEQVNNMRNENAFGEEVAKKFLADKLGTIDRDILNQIGETLMSIALVEGENDQTRLISLFEEYLSPASDAESATSRKRRIQNEVRAILA